MERQAMQAALTSPYGSFEWNDNYGVFLPNDGKGFTPVLLHVNYRMVEPDIIESLNDLLQKENPPIILFTYGDKFSNVASLFAEWKRDGFLSNIDAVFSIVNPKMGLDGGFSTTFDNIPADLEHMLRVALNTDKMVGPGLSSKIAEGFASSFNKPAVSLNVVLRHDAEALFKVLGYVPQYPDFDYSRYISSVPSTEGEVCSCCGKKRGPLKFFAKVAAFICPVCEKKIRKIGPVNIVNWVAASFALQQERAVTRRANSEKQIRQAGRHTCPVCGGLLPVPTQGKSSCSCGKEYFITSRRFYEIREGIGPTEYVYAYSTKKTGARKLIGTFPLSSDDSPVVKCEQCQEKTTKWKWIADPNYSTVKRMCLSCAKRTEW